MGFSEKLVSLRRANGFSQEQLANMINVSRQAISKWETTESQPDLAKLILISNVFEVSLDELCGRIPEPDIAPSKNRSRFVWIFTVSIILSLVIGLTGGFFASDIFLQDKPQQEISSMSISDFNIISELWDNNMHLVFVPSITATSDDDYKYSCKVMKIDSYGNVSNYPADIKEGVITSDIDIDILQGDFTLHAVISDGTYDHTISLVKIIDLHESGYGSVELWNN